MQRIVFAAFSALLVLLSAADAQERTDFSGTWRMDPSRSESAHQAVPIGPVTMVIQQTASALSVETRRREAGKSEVSTETLTYPMDGTDSTNTGTAGVPVKVKAHWDGAKLVVETARELQGSSLTTTQVFSLDPAGREMTIDKTLMVQHGYQFQGAKVTGHGKDVFVRAKVQAKK